MGNVCGCASGGDAQEGAAKQRQETAGTSAPPAHTNVRTSTASKQQPVDPIEAALVLAKKELDKNHNAKFEDSYVISKLIGHGAFAKVSICTHNVTKEKYAVKSVNKNLEDPQKQRDGEQLGAVA